MEEAKAVSVLNELVEVSKDGEAGFHACAEGAKDTTLKGYFEECATRCGRAAAELSTEVDRLGGKAEDSGSVSGAMHRAFVNVKASVSDNDDLAMLDECERGEDVALKAYAAALDEPLPPGVRVLVQSQYQGVKHNHDRIKALRDERRRKTA